MQPRNKPGLYLKVSNKIFPPMVWSYKVAWDILSHISANSFSQGNSTHIEVHWNLLTSAISQTVSEKMGQLPTPMDVKKTKPIQIFRMETTKDIFERFNL